jgi:hypothetical protein
LTGSALTGIAPHLLSAGLLPSLPETVRLGRIRPKARPLALALSNYLSAEALAASPPPPSVDYAAKAMAALSRMYLNDQYGDCVIAGKYHAVGLWSGNDAGSPVLGSDSEVYSSYQTICGPGDNGCVITDVLDYMRANGLPFGGVPHKIDGYINCNWRNKTLVQASIYLFGGLEIGINLPNAWTSAAVWDVTNTQIVGGHLVFGVGYNAQGVQISSWGRIYTITWAAFQSTEWLEECYALLAPDWYGSDKLAPSGVDVATLRADLQKVGGGTVPPIDPPLPVCPAGQHWDVGQQKCVADVGPLPLTPLFPEKTFIRAVRRGSTVSFAAPVDIPLGSKLDVYAPANSTGEAALDESPLD